MLFIASLLLFISTINCQNYNKYEQLGRFTHLPSVARGGRRCNDPVCNFNCPDANGNDCTGTYICGPNCSECNFIAEPDHVFNAKLISNAKGSTFVQCKDENSCTNGLEVVTDVPNAGGFLTPRVHVQGLLNVLCGMKGCENIRVDCNGRIKKCAFVGMQNHGSGMSFKHVSLSCRQTLLKSQCLSYCGDIMPAGAQPEHHSCDAVQINCMGKSSCACCGSSCIYGMFPMVPSKRMLACPLMDRYVLP